MKIELTVTEAKYLCLKALGVQAELKSRAGLHVLNTQAEIEIVPDLGEAKDAQV